MSFISPTIKTSPSAQYITLAAGCFWGVEHIYRKHFTQAQGLIDCKVGYSGDIKHTNPTYEQICQHITNFAEVLQIAYDPVKLPTETVIDFFFRIHDPTSINQQGPDIGTQYRSAIFYHNDEQKKIAEQMKEKFQKTFYKDKIVTEILPIKDFYDAEAYHQLYLEHNPSGYQCPTHFIRTKPQI